MPTPKAKRAQVADRRAKAIALRLAGMDWQTIADRLDYPSRGAACTDVSRAMEANLEEQRTAVEVMREVESERLDRLQAAAWQSAARGDLKAIETVIKLIDRRIKLHGLDTPVRTEVTGADGGPLAFSRVDAAELEALISATGRLDTDHAANTATRTSGQGDGDA